MLPEQCDVLLVQDNPLEVELTIRPLRDLSADTAIGVAGDGEEALDYLLGRGAYRHRLGAPLPRVVLLDLKLPRVDGMDVLRAVRASHRASSAPVVILVPASEPRELAQCYQLGANSCVCKPVEYPAYYAVIQTIGRYWLSVNQPPPASDASMAGADASRRPG